MKQFAKPLPDGGYEIAGSVIIVGGQKIYYPTERTLRALGYLPIIDTIPNKEIEGYKLVNKGITREGDHFLRHLVQLKIVDKGPNPGPGQELKSDYWKETETQYIHVYKYRSVTRHITPTKFDPPPEKKALSSSQKSAKKKKKKDKSNEDN